MIGSAKVTIPEKEEPVEDCGDKLRFSVAKWALARPGLICNPENRAMPRFPRSWSASRLADVSLAKYSTLALTLCPLVDRQGIDA